MAETALYLALRKISLASRRDDDSSDSVILAMFQSRLRRIESELRMVHCFLDQRETRYSNNQVLVSWIAEAQRLGRLVEETVDVHIDRIFRPFGRTWRSQPGIPGLVLVALLPALLMKSIDARRGAFIQLTELEEELQHLSKMKKLWIQVANDPEAGYIPGISEMANLSNNQQLLSDFTDEETVAYDEERHELTRRLENSADGAHKVVAVWGPAGSGKTTFVRSVYEEQRSHFDCCAWITMSCCSSAEDVLNKMCRELCLEGKATITVGDHVRQSAEALMPDDLHIDHDTDQKPWKHLIEALRHSDLSEKKLLVVLDGVNVVIDGISEVLREIQWRSRIIIITRIKAVAEVVEGASIIKLAGLKEPKALELFQRMVGKGLDTSVEKKKIGMEIFHQCKRLPQVIVSIGALLSLNQSTQSTFQQVQKQLGWVSKNNSILVGDTSKYLYVAYINLPKHLKVCLLYCGIFPAGHLLFRDNLVRLLVAEGFIEKQRPSEVDEEIAEEYLKVLTRLGFLQLVDCNEFGQVVSLRVPIVVHELVQSICRKEGFGIASDDFDLPQTDTNFRCLFTSKYPQDIHSLMQLRHVRTLIVSDSAAADSVIEKKKKVARYSNGSDLVLADDLLSTIATVISICIHETSAGVRKQNTFAYMTVLEFQGYPLKDVPRYIHFLINLRYLGLRKTEVRSLPREMKRLYNMQTLDLESSNITKLPIWIGELVRLRNLLAGCLIEENERKVLKGVGVAKSVRKLKDLYTLQTVEASPTFVKNVDMLTHLRNLRVSNVDRKSWRTLVDKISKLCSLTSFAVSAKGQNEVLDLDGYRLSFKQLKSLELSNCKLGEDPFKLLSNIFPNLVFLSLYGVSGIKKIEFEVNGFTKLRALNLREMTDVKKLQIPVGALASLEVLRVESLTELNVEDVGQLDKIRSIKKCFFPQLTHRLVTTDVPESSSRAAQL